MKGLGFIVLLMTLVGWGQSVPPEPHPPQGASAVQWLSWSEAMERFEKEPRKIFLDVYTKWCGWCKRMDAKTFQDPNIAAYLNEHYYPVKFDAEYSEELSFKGKAYRFVRSGRRGFHQLAFELTGGRLSFPTSVFLDENLSVIQSIPGYMEPPAFEQIITYFAEDHYKRVPWGVYQRNYTPLSARKSSGTRN